jgi:hypothetical protein
MPGLAVERKSLGRSAMPCRRHVAAPPMQARRSYRRIRDGAPQDAVILEHGAGTRVAASAMGGPARAGSPRSSAFSAVLMTRGPYAGTTYPRVDHPGAQLIDTVTQPAINYLGEHGATGGTIGGTSADASDAIQVSGAVEVVDVLVGLVARLHRHWRAAGDGSPLPPRGRSRPVPRASQFLDVGRPHSPVRRCTIRARQDEIDCATSVPRATHLANRIEHAVREAP